MTREIDRRQVDQLTAEGLSQREIAKRLDIPRTTLRDFLQRPCVPEVYQGIPEMPRAKGHHGLASTLPAVASDSTILTEFASIQAELWELAEWWRLRKLRRVDPGTPRDTVRQTWHVDKRWVEAVKQRADLEGVSYAAIVDEAFRQYFEGRFA